MAESNPSSISAKVIEAAGHQPQVQTVKFCSSFSLQSVTWQVNTWLNTTLQLTT